MIKAGERYRCIEEYIMDNGDIAYYKGKIYQSKEDGKLSSEIDEDHTMNSDDEFSNHFVLYNTIYPQHYQYNIKGTLCDLFDIGNAMDLNKEQFTALRYFRKKENQIEDTKKAIKCLERLVERLEAEKND